MAFSFIWQVDSKVPFSIEVRREDPFSYLRQGVKTRPAGCYSAAVTTTQEPLSPEVAFSAKCIPRLIQSTLTKTMGCFRKGVICHLEYSARKDRAGGNGSGRRKKMSDL
uniref:Uncharacterized protein n=1 Tax=Setaria viridis TaxID=4556 RepID=A0A4U6U558_SETVI|nr:hypothetical protein SEVIR_6G031700v2 [Setaria viridis]